MSDHSAIEWTDATWNFLKGCTPVSAGCLNCYAAAVAHQKQSNPVEKVAAQFRDLTTLKRAGEGQRPVFNGKINVVEHLIEAPLHWRKGKRIFVNSLSDLFHEDVPLAVIDKAFAVMALSQQHVFQILTKRPENMAAYCSILPARFGSEVGASELLLSAFPGKLFSITQIRDVASQFVTGAPDNVWCGTSVEDQAAADERIPELLRTRARVRFLSCEPLLGAVNLGPWLADEVPTGFRVLSRYYGREGFDPHGAQPEIKFRLKENPGLHWVIIGGESGPHSRQMDIGWVRELVEQCRAARIPTFVKQFGARPTSGEYPAGWSGSFGTDGGAWYLRPCDKKGGDWSEWPEDLRVRQFPEVAHA